MNAWIYLMYGRARRRRGRPPVDRRDVDALHRPVCAEDEEEEPDDRLDEEPQGLHGRIARAQGRQEQRHHGL